VDDLAGYLTALGLAAAAGLNAWIPLLVVGVLGRVTDLVALTGPWEALSSTPVLVVLAAVAVADLVGDKIPGVDHVLHLGGTVVAPVAAVVAALAATGDLDVSPALVLLIGLAGGEGTHLARMAVRPASTMTTAGLGNPVISGAEDAASLGLALAAIAVPLVALALVVALLAGGWLALRRMGRAAVR
jgi:hypothetical protein